MQELISFRQDIHRHPEVSGFEIQTSGKVRTHLEKTGPDQIIENIGGNGLAAIYNGKSEGPIVLFRCELDALPIPEISTLPYRSKNKNTGHLCGHDGHMTIMLGLATLLRKKRPDSGKVVLLFQAAEETGEGAAKVILDPKFQDIKPDYVFALHNLPGYPARRIVLAKTIFASASTGLEILLKGKSSHAAEPEKGINPAIAVSRIIQSFADYQQILGNFRDFTLITIIHALIGEIAYGTSPGDAELRATLRAFRQGDMEKLKADAVKIARRISAEEGLEASISFHEEFPSTVCDTVSSESIANICDEEDWEYEWLEKPFRWSEDFGHFTRNYTGALFGLGSGKDCPALHNPDYDFPDEIIERGSFTFYKIAEKILKTS